MKVKHIILFFTLLSQLQLWAHPTGNMVVVGDTVLWPYIDPIDDMEHHACIMSWKEGSKPKIIFKSEFSASDFMLYSNSSEIYIVERKYVRRNDTFQCRILKMTLHNKPKVLWDWFEDKWRVGEGGFYMTSDTQIIFASQTNILRMNKGQTPVQLFKFGPEVYKMRAISKSELLLSGNDQIWLVDTQGNIKKSWKNLIDKSILNAPLNMNSIFDADYKNGELLLAYWGKRSFDLITNKGNQKTLYQLSAPSTPHWVAFWGEHKLLFASNLVFDGSTPKPHLVLLDETGSIKDIWKI